ncbi:hypothetical protein LY28_01947 [Ruminiclostridium sufflavum DSM 19573]|uniref:Uncharacterized protein n=1 Tax=Ruminiclostridium sufflavum DSM 19573 TaxID=1121337 RepID=A0A318XM02_9FIRM|nr:hypothetical protein [Ruminiclostridium sufflavum]PYG87578.1 hypothetical protein LY28_01947 [Ruminiclostridium sufflavum DSM 19573]
MKINFFRLKKRNESKKDKHTIFENLLFGICILSFLLLVAIQIVLGVPSVRETFKLTDKSLGVPLDKDDYLYKQGQITLKMIGTEADPTVQILVNGDTVAMFENLIMNVKVNEGDVIEIDGSHCLTGHMVKVDAVSQNINSKCAGTVAKVESNIQKLVKIKFY